MAELTHNDLLKHLDQRFELTAKEMLSILSISDLAQCQNISDRRLTSQFMASKTDIFAKTFLRWFTPAARGFTLTFVTAAAALLCGVFAHHFSEYSELEGLFWSALAILGSIFAWSAALYWITTLNTSNLEQNPLAQQTLQTLPEKKARHDDLLHMVSRIAPFASTQKPCQFYEHEHAWALVAPLTGGNVATVQVIGSTMRLRISGPTINARSRHIVFPEGLKPTIRTITAPSGSPIFELADIYPQQAHSLERRYNSSATLADIVGQALAATASTSKTTLHHTAHQKCTQVHNTPLDHENTNKIRLKLNIQHLPQAAVPQSTALFSKIWMDSVVYWSINAALALIALPTTLVLTISACFALIGSSVEALAACLLTLAALSCWLGVHKWVGQVLQQRPRIPRRKKTIVPVHTAGFLVLDEAVLHTGQPSKGIDLDEPFGLHLFRAESEHDDAQWITLELRQNRDGHPIQLRFSALFPNVNTLSHLPKLSTYAPSLNTDDLLKQLWPHIRDKAQAHGTHIDADLSLVAKTPPIFEESSFAAVHAVVASPS